MSRIGKLPVAIPAGVTVEMKDNNVLSVKGPKGTLEKQFAPEIKIEQKDGEIVVTRPNDNKKEKSLHGLTRALIHNMVDGVTHGFEEARDQRRRLQSSEAGQDPDPYTRLFSPGYHGRSGGC